METPRALLKSPSKNMTDEEFTKRMTRTVTTKIREERIGAGVLRIHESWVDGQLIAEAFTLDSLAHVLDMPMSTMEGRYKRARLSRWMVPVNNYASRPIRGFPYVLFDQVVEAVQHPRAYVDSDVNGSGVAVEPRKRQVQELVPDYFIGQRYYTVAALARAFGYSETTVRKKLNAAGLLRRFQNLASPTHGGRPKRGIHEKYLGEVKMAVTDSVRFFTKYDMSVYRATGALQRAREEMREAVVAHTPPAPMQAWNPETLSPATKAPVNGVNPTQADIELAQNITAEFERILKDATPAPAPVASMPTDAQARRAQLAEEAANRAALVEPHRQQLIAQDEEPSAEELDDVTYALDLTGAAKKDFIDSVKQGWAARNMLTR